MIETTEHRRFKDQAYGLLEQVGKALGSRRRLELLDILSQGPRNVEALADEANISVASTSQHLQKLKQAMLVSAERRGTQIYYQVASTAVAELFAELRAMAQHQLPALEVAVREHFQEPSVSIEEVDDVLAAVRAGDAILIDTRPRAEFDAGHVSGARSVPYMQMEPQLSQLPRDVRIIAYCRGPYCSFAESAVQNLRQQGFDAVRLELGVADFRRLGIEIEAQSD